MDMPFVSPMVVEPELGDAFEAFKTQVSAITDPSDRIDAVGEARQWAEVVELKVRRFKPDVVDVSDAFPSPLTIPFRRQDLYRLVNGLPDFVPGSSYHLVVKLVGWPREPLRIEFKPPTMAAPKPDVARSPSADEVARLIEQARAEERERARQEQERWLAEAQRRTEEERRRVEEERRRTEEMEWRRAVLARLERPPQGESELLKLVLPRLLDRPAPAPSLDLGALTGVITSIVDAIRKARPAGESGGWTPDAVAEVMERALPPVLGFVQQFTQPKAVPLPQPVLPAPDAPAPPSPVDGIGGTLRALGLSDVDPGLVMRHLPTIRAVLSNPAVLEQIAEGLAAGEDGGTGEEVTG